MIKEKNFTAMAIQDIPVDTEYVDCNFARGQPLSINPGRSHRLFPGDDTPRTFIRCNLLNCEPPPGSTVINCNTWVVEKGIPAHTDQVVVDGETVFTKQYYDSKQWGRYDPDTGTYIDDVLQMSENY